MSIDAFTTEANYKKYMFNKEQNHPLTKVTLLTKAEDELAVAVSSIICRICF